MFSQPLPCFFHGKKTERLLCRSWPGAQQQSPRAILAKVLGVLDRVFQKWIPEQLHRFELLAQASFSRFRRLIIETA